MSASPCGHVGTQYKLSVPSADSGFIYWCLDLKHPTFQKCKNRVHLQFLDFIWRSAGQGIYHRPSSMALVSVVNKPSSCLDFFVIVAQNDEHNLPGKEQQKETIVTNWGGLSCINQRSYIMRQEYSEGS